MVVGVTFGFASVEVKPAGVLVHEYVFPEYAIPPIEMELPAQIAVLAIIEVDEGKEIVSELVLEHPVAVIFSVKKYVVATDGLTVGFDEVEENPAGELVHE